MMTVLSDQVCGIGHYCREIILGDLNTFCKRGFTNITITIEHNGNPKAPPHEKEYIDFINNLTGVKFNPVCDNKFLYTYTYSGEKLWNISLALLLLRGFPYCDIKTVNKNYMDNLVRWAKIDMELNGTDQYMAMYILNKDELNSKLISINPPFQTGLLNYIDYLICIDPRFYKNLVEKTKERYQIK